MITEYVDTALSRADYEKLEDGSFVATVPGMRGVIATGKSLEKCRTELREVIEEWLLVRVSRNLPVPSLGKKKILVRKAS